jgi:stage II sporulation protein M
MWGTRKSVLLFVTWHLSPDTWYPGGLSVNQELNNDREPILKTLIRLLARDWGYIAGIAGIFVLGIWVGREFVTADPQAAQELANGYIKRLSEIANTFKNAPVYVGILVIWLNNLSAGLAAIIFGLLLGPLFPLLLVFGNGVMIGVFERIILLKMKLSVFHFYTSIIPHGIFELPAFFITAWVGICFGIIVYGHLWSFIRGRGEGPFFRTLALKVRAYFLTEARYYILFAVILFFIAATIEMTVSPMLLK